MTSDNAPTGTAAPGPRRTSAEQVLAETGLLDADETGAMDAVATLAARICGTPMAAVSLVEGARQFFAGSVGLDVRGTDRSSSFCAVAMQTPDDPMLVPDAVQDPRFATNPLVLGAPDVRSYAGMPLTAQEGVPVGAVCALGTSRMDLDPGQVEALRALGDVASELLHAHRTASRLEVALRQVEQARAAEASSRARWLSVVEHAPLGITVVSADGRYAEVNPAFAALLGRSVGELVGTGTWEVTVAEDAQDDAAATARMLASGQGLWRREKRYVRPDGSVVRAMLTSSLVPAEDDTGPVLLNQVESVEQRRAAESRLLELQSAHDGIVSTDESGRVTAWNLGAERLLGHSASVMLGQGLERIVPAELVGAHSAGLERLRAGGAPRLLGSTVEVPAVHADGHRLLVELSLAGWTQDGRSGYTAVLRDVTARRHAELLADLVRSAASTANSARGFAVGAGEILRDVCERLGWIAGHAWTAEDPVAVWALGPHAHGPGVPCGLVPLSARGGAPTSERLPLDSQTRVTAAEALLSTALGAEVLGCGIESAVAVPVLAGGETVGMLAFYLPTDLEHLDGGVIGTLEQIGTLLGRVVERERSSAELRHQAEHDPLTDLANRRRLLQEISAAQEAAGHRLGAGTAALLLVDLDRFGLINSSFGHLVGDQVLLEAARRLREVAAPGDVVARLGGDEFVLLLRMPIGSGHDEAEAAARRVLAALSGPVHVGSQRLPLGASVGVCVLGPEHAVAPHSPATVLRDADAALRSAKRNGKGRVAVHDATMRTDDAQRLLDETDLAAAVTAGRLELHYQPVVDLASGRPVGAEALVRWPRPGHGLVRPDRFIPLAESCGLIVELGRWVLRQACHDAAQWHTTVPALAAARVSVNVSTRQLVHPDFVDEVRGALDHSGLPVERLVLEITESTLIEDREHTWGVLAQLRRLGVRLALDDFGTGYSSLSWVKDLPVDVLKIDKSFVDPVTGVGEGTALAEVVLKLAGSAGLQTVAEGIETEQQAAALRSLGCQAAQGYLWSRPVPLASLAAAVDVVPPPTGALIPGQRPAPAPSATVSSRALNPSTR